MRKAIITSIITAFLTVFLTPAAEIAYNALEKPHKRRSRQANLPHKPAYSSVLERLSGLVFGAECRNGVCITNDQYIIDTDGTEFTINQLASAIYIAEGAENAKKPFGILSVACRGYDDCRQICINTIRANLRRFAEYRPQYPSTYLDFLGSRYCPIGARNDKAHNLNQYWLKNVRSILKKGDNYGT